MGIIYSYVSYLFNKLGTRLLYMAQVIVDNCYYTTFTFSNIFKHGSLDHWSDCLSSNFNFLFYQLC